MRYKVSDYYEDKYFNDIGDVLDYCISSDYHDDDDYFEEWVNDNYPSVTINGETYYPYSILCELDEGNLRDLQNAYCEMENENDSDNARYELERASVGDEVYVQGYTVTVIEDDEPEDDEEIPENIMNALREKLLQYKQLEQQNKEENKKTEDALLQLIGG